MPSLRRVSDGAGDSGPMSMLFSLDDDGQVVYEHGAPKVGWCVRVGSPYTRSYSGQDYWTTTPVTEILEETEDMVRFKTRSNSEYVWKK